MSTRRDTIFRGGSTRPTHSSSAQMSTVGPTSPFYRDHISAAPTDTFSYSGHSQLTEDIWTDNWDDPIPLPSDHMSPHPPDSGFGAVPRPMFISNSVVWPPSTITPEGVAGLSSAREGICVANHHHSGHSSHGSHDRRRYICIHPGQSNNQETSISQIPHDHDVWPVDVVPRVLMQSNDTIRKLSGNNTDDNTLWESYKSAFKDQGRQRLAFVLSKEAWLQRNEKEPSISHLLQTGIIHEGDLPRNANSVFEAFHERSEEYQCIVFDNGKQCLNKFHRKERATAHARSHFDYMPFACDGGCETDQCQRRYTCQALLNDHQNRSKNPRRKCDICGEVLTCQNLRRHMETKHPSTENESQQDQPGTSKEKKRIVPTKKLRTNTSNLD